MTVYYVEAALPWEEQGERLPEDLHAVLQRLGSGELSIDPRSLMDQGDWSKNSDRVLKQVQQKALGLLKVYPILHD
jgi:hypothetical protein